LCNFQIANSWNKLYKKKSYVVSFSH
jgi:hypothetical protein